ncbi:MAG TPA: SHOCT domain-containing protein [Candidatus Dormibacteraeota bacterium]
MRRGLRRAVVGTAAISHVANKSAQAGAAQAQQAAAAQAQPAPVAAAPPAPPPAATDAMDSKVEQLTKLADLNKAGILSDEEFAAEKAKILAS